MDVFHDFLIIFRNFKLRKKAFLHKKLTILDFISILKYIRVI